MRGLGELTANLWFDDPLCLNLYRQCGEVGLPIIFHLAVDVAYGLYGVADDPGLPRLEKVLRDFPNTTFFGHAMAFWAEVSAEVKPEERGGYPAGPVTAVGRTVELLRTYPNLYGDLSAGSGFNAISRDPIFGYRFLEELQDKLLFGTDICHVNQEVPHRPVSHGGAGARHDLGDVLPEDRPPERGACAGVVVALVAQAFQLALAMVAGTCRRCGQGTAHYTGHLG